jgi:hypothetical protein
VLEEIRNDPPPDCWRVEAAGMRKRWGNGVRLGTRAEAEAYGEFHARHEVKDFERFEVVHCPDEQANCSVIRRQRGGRTTLLFPDGGCTLTNWSPVGRVRRARRASLQR